MTPLAPRSIRIGIDASNIRMGGGVTALAETLERANPAAHGIERITVWAPSATLDRLPSRHWLTAERHPWLDGRLPARVAWQRLELTPRLRATADLLFVPGGSFHGDFRPFVAMAQSLLPFDADAWRRYPITSWMRMRNRVVRGTMSRTMHRADGMIFLTQYGRDLIGPQVGGVQGQCVVIPLGRTPGVVPRTQTFAQGHFRWLYMSTVDFYKNHQAVVRAVTALVREGHDTSVDFVGPAYPPALEKLRREIRRCDPTGRVARYLGAVPPERVRSVYAEYDGFVFASSCESFGIPLIDALHAGLPTACSTLSTMPEIARDGVDYFDPRDEASVAASMRRVMTNSEIRQQLATRGRMVARDYDWAVVAKKTMEFLAAVARS